MENVIETSGLTKRYGSVAALDDVGVTVRRGDIFGLVGDNGAGKTTLFKLLCGLAFPSAGEMRLFGVHTPRDLERQRARVGAIIESPGFYPSLSVERNLECCRIQKGVPGREAVGRLLEEVGLDWAKDRLGKELSMGMRQRLGLAMALIGEPELLILDEPTSGLDPSGIVEMRALLLRLNREKGITVVVSSHHLAELEQMATVYAFLNRGRLMEQVSAEQLRARCADCIDIAVSDPAGYTVLLERERPGERYQVLPDGAVRILDPQAGAEAYSGLASAHGMDVCRLERRTMSLEQYYLDMREKGAA
ncbi:ABC transporter ATP-binding protein [Arabiibacter massiliensis]|uniref:ABC transporter ATP-binding protein n=1 Tax=Arabiibacter massiliensis TaxID=1870985 RepID=UPI0009B98068|nr:ABC transporter ATP-binding protein [Arabiibacter massiliensis]